MSNRHPHHHSHVPMPPSTPDATCRAIMELSIRDGLASLEHQLRTLKADNSVTGFMERNALKQMQLYLNSRSIYQTDFRVIAGFAEPEHLAVLLKKNGIAVPDIYTVHNVVQQLPDCASKVALQHSIDQIKERLAAPSPAACSVTDDRLNEFELPSPQALANVKRCAAQAR